MTNESSIARDTSWSFMAEVARLVAGVGVFLLVARALGPTQFGLFIAIASIVNFTLPFANLGSSLLLVQRVRRDDKDIGESFRTALTMTLVGGAIATAVMSPLLSLFLDDAPPAAIVGVSLGEYVFGATVALCGYASIAQGDMRTSALVTCADSAARVAAAVFLLALSRPTVTGWAVAECVGAVITATLMIRLTSRRHHIRIGVRRLVCQDVIDGLPYSASLAAFSAQDGVDKPLMVRFGWGVDAGLYAAAYRIPALAFVPVQALLVATFNRSFTAGKAGIDAAMRLARRLLIPSLAYSVVAALAIMAFAPLARPLLGDDFEGALPMLRWLAVLPVIRTLQYFPANAITGAGYPRKRLLLLVITLVVNLALCLALIPDHSWRGAATATIIAESLYAVMLWITVGVLHRREAAAAIASATDDNDEGVEHHEG